MSQAEKPMEASHLEAAIHAFVFDWTKPVSAGIPILYYGNDETVSSKILLLQWCRMFSTTLSSFGHTRKGSVSSSFSESTAKPPSSHKVENNQHPWKAIGFCGGSMGQGREVCCSSIIQPNSNPAFKGKKKSGFCSLSYMRSQVTTSISMLIK